MAFELILESTLKKYKLEHLMPDFSEMNIKSENPTGQATLISDENEENASVISSPNGSSPGMIPDGFTDICDVKSETETGTSIPQQGTSQKKSNPFRLPRLPDESCLDKTSKWLDGHNIDSQTNRLAPPEENQNNEERAHDSDDTDSDLEPEKDSTKRAKSFQSNPTANKVKTEMVDQRKETESDKNSELDKPSSNHVSSSNPPCSISSFIVISDDEDSPAPSESFSGLPESTSDKPKTIKTEPRILQEQNNSDFWDDQSSVCSDAFDNDSIAPIRKYYGRKTTPKEQNQSQPSTSSENRYASVISKKRPEKRKIKDQQRVPKKRMKWDDNEDRKLMEGFKKYKNDKLIWTMIKHTLFADSPRTNVNLKDRARTLGLK